MKTRVLLSIAPALLLVNVAMAEVQKTPVPESSFQRVEYKILLDIPGISAKDSIAVTHEKINTALDMVDVTIGSGGSGRAYLDSKDQRLRKNDYILRWKKGAKKVTLKARWKDVSKAHLLTGEGFDFSNYEIDYVDDSPIYSISYSVKIGDVVGDATGAAILNAIKANSPDIGAFLEGLLAGAELEIPGWATAHGTSATLKAGSIPSLADSTLKMDVDVFYFGTELAIAELSFRKSDTVNVQTYKELTALLREKGLLNAKQTTKTSYYLDYFAK